MKIETKNYIDNQIGWLTQYTKAEMNSVRQAVAETKSTYDLNEIKNNEFRQTLKDQGATFVTRRELWSAVAIIIAMIIGILSYLK